MRSYIDNPQHWRDRAEEARIQAEQMRDEDTRRMMLETAAGYDRMAERAEKRIVSATILSFADEVEKE